VSRRDGSLIEGFTFNRNSPAWHVAVPRGKTAATVLDDFNLRVIRHQPWRFIRAVAGDFLRPFIHWTRSRASGELPIERWRFSADYPRYVTVTPVVHRWGGDRVRVDRSAALLLRRYQLTVGYAPGPLLGAAALLGLAGALRGRRRTGLRATCLLWTSTGLLLFLAAVVYEFSWRYFVPVIVALPPAGAFGLSALFARTPARAGARDAADGAPATAP
jgi:hypothetical protein